MNWIVNTEEEQYFKNILFVYAGRNWEITVNYNLSSNEIDILIDKRIKELELDFIEFKSYDFSDLIVDWTTKKEDNE